MNELVATRLPVDWEPDVGRLPLHAPEATQAVARVELQLNVEAPPDSMVPGFAVRDTVGGGSAVPTATVRMADPPGPLHLRVKLVAAESAPVDSDPLVARVPDQPPVASQSDASVDVHVSVDVPPEGTLVGFADKDRVGGGLADTATDTEAFAVPPAPVQARE